MASVGVLEMGWAGQSWKEKENKNSHEGGLERDVEREEIDVEINLIPKNGLRF